MADDDGKKWVPQNRFVATCSGTEYKPHNPTTFELVRTREGKTREAACPVEWCAQVWKCEIRGDGWRTA